MQNYFYRDQAGQEIGPLPLDALAKLRFADVLNDETPVRLANSAEWKACREIIAAPADGIKNQTQPTVVEKAPLSPILIIIIILAGLAYGGTMLYKFIAAKTSVAYEFSLDGKALSSSQVPGVKIDDQLFQSGGKIKPGRHTISVDLKNVEPFERHFWVFFGAKNLGALPLESSKGSLSVVVNPSPAKVIIRCIGSNPVYIPGETVRETTAPVTIDKMPVGDYALEIRRGGYQETHTETIERNKKEEVKIDLDLGTLALSSDPPDAEFELSGNGYHWNGKLPSQVGDVPVGDYTLVARRNGWKISTNVSVTRGVITTNQTEFPYASIEITSEPLGLSISSDDGNLGKTPLTIRVKPGEYTLTATDGENDLKKTVTVAAKEAAKESFVFRYGSVELASTPTGATIFRKGKEIGKTPMVVSHVPVGQTGIELRLTGYLSTNVPINAVENSTTKLSVKLVDEKYVSLMADARRAMAADPPDFQQAVQSIKQALQIYPDEAEAVQLRKDCEYRLNFSEASQALGKSDLDSASSKIDAALVLKPAEAEAVELKSKIRAAIAERNRLAATRADQLSMERTVEIERSFEQRVANLVEQHKSQPLTQAVFSYRTFASRVNSTPSDVNSALLRTINASSPKWKVEEQNTVGDTTLIYLRPKMLLGSSLYHIIVQICQLPNRVVDVCANMVMSVVPDPDPGYPDRMRQAGGSTYSSFVSSFQTELQTVSVKPDSEQSASSTASSKDNGTPSDPKRLEIIEFLKRAIAAKGGREVLERFKISKTTANVTGRVRGKNYTMNYQECIEPPDKLREDQRMTSGISGAMNSGWDTYYLIGDRAISMAKPVLGFIPKTIDPDSEARMHMELYEGECASLTPRACH